MKSFSETNILEYKMRLCETNEINLIDQLKKQRKEMEIMMKERRKNKLECCCVGIGGMLVFGNCSLNDSEIILFVNNKQKSKIIINKGEFSWFFQTKERGIWKVEMRNKDILLVGIDNIYLESYTGISSISWKFNKYIEVSFINKVLEDCWLSLWEQTQEELRFVRERKMDRGVKVFCFDGKSLKSGKYIVKLHVVEHGYTKERKSERMFEKIKSERDGTIKKKRDETTPRRDIDRKHVIHISSFNVTVNK